MKQKNRIKSILISFLLITAFIATSLPSASIQAAIEYESFELTRDNVYKTGLCEQGEAPSGKVVIPATFEYDGKNYKITSIGDGAFEANKKITSVEIPDTVKTIGMSAFYNCTKLKTVTLPEKLDSIGNAAFADCSSLKKIHINAKTVGEYTFGDCSKLEKVTFGDNVKTIGTKALYNTGIKEITISGATSVAIGGGCFHRTAIKSINFDKNIKEIGYWAVAECSNLTSITIGEKVTTLGQMINTGSNNLKTVTIKSTKLTAKKCGIMGGKNGDLYLGPICATQIYNSSTGKITIKNITIKVPKSKLNSYKKILVNNSGLGKYTFKTL